MYMCVCVCVCVCVHLRMAGGHTVLPVLVLHSDLPPVLKLVFLASVFTSWSLSPATAFHFLESFAREAAIFDCTFSFSKPKSWTIGPPTRP
jgi:hypothetical protein